MRVSLLIFLLGFITIAPSIYYGAKLFDGKVTEKPYETGVEYSRLKHIVDDNNIALAEIKAKEDNGKCSVVFRVNKNDGVGFDNISFFVSRPGSNKGMVKLNAEKKADGSYSGVFSTEEKGNFILEAKAKISGDEISFQKNFYIN